MNTTLALAFFWFLFASSSGFGVTGDFSKNKLQYDIANVRQLPISYKVFRKIIENYLKNNKHGLDDVQGKYGHFLRDRRSQAEKDFQLLPWQMEYSSPRLRRDAHSEAVAKKEDAQLVPWQMEYSSPRMRRDARSEAVAKKEDAQLVPWQMEYSSPRLRRDARAESVTNKEDGQLLPWEMEYFTPRLS